MCRYCYGKCVDDFLKEDEEKNYDLTLPPEISYSIEQLQKFAAKDPELVITFYGGEPLLKKDKIIEIMDNVPAKDFMIQTNGWFLDKLPFEYINRMSTILVSIDGTKKHTNFCRGKGVYEKVITNVKKLREQGYTGHIIARMTVDETSQVYDNVLHLIEQPKLFDGVHWQMDAQFFEADFKTRNYKEWTQVQYNPQITQLIEWWIEQITTTNKVPLIYPLTAVMNTLLTNEKVPLRCGAGHSVLGLQTNGIVAACPITAGFKPLYMGDLTNSPSELLQKTIVPDRQCTTCEIRNVCGGRCLYANKSQFWGKEGFSQVCDTVFHLVNELKRHLPIIEEKLKQKQLTLESFAYTKYNGVEVIP